jgi:hypothetical protein
MSLDTSLGISGYIWFVLGFFDKFSGKEGEKHTGPWSQNSESE